MDKNPPRSEKERASQRKEFLFSLAHRVPRNVVDDLQPEDIEHVRQIGAGEVPDISRAARLKCLRIMAYLDDPRDGEVLADVVGNEKEDSQVRAAAAVNLAFLTPERAQKHLMEHLEVEDDLVRSKVIKSLGMVGGPEAYEALSSLDSPTDFVNRQLTFARALVAYRHNLDADPLPFTKGVQRRQRSEEQLLQLTVKLARGREMEQATERFQGSKYGIELSQSMGLQVSAGRAKWVLFINKQPADEGIIKSINRRKMIMGLLSLWIMETQTYDPQYVVLTKPTEDEKVQIMVVRSDGEMSYSGEAAVKGSIMSFIVSDIKRRATAPTRVRGKLTLRGIELELSIPVRAREGKRKPRTIKAEEIYSKFSDMFK